MPITAANPFKWRHYPGDIIIWCVRWYLRYPISVAQNRAYPVAVEDLKQEGAIRRRCQLGQCKYLNNIIEQDHGT